MPFKVFQVTLGAGATPIVDGTVLTTHKTPAQEIHLNPHATHAYYFGNSDVSTTKYGERVPNSTTAYAVIIGNGPGAISIDVLENLYLIGTQNDVINVGVVTL